MGRLTDSERDALLALGDNGISVRDLLRLAIDDIDRGLTNPHSCILVVMRERIGEEKPEASIYRVLGSFTV